MLSDSDDFESFDFVRRREFSLRTSGRRPKSFDISWHRSSSINIALYSSTIVASKKPYTAGIYSLTFASGLESFEIALVSRNKELRYLILSKILIRSSSLIVAHRSFFDIVLCRYATFNIVQQYFLYPIFLTTRRVITSRNADPRRSPSFCLSSLMSSVSTATLLS